MRVTKEIIQNQCNELNKLCKLNGIDKSYEIGYRYEHCYLDEKSNTHEHCIVRSIMVGTKREVSECITAICYVLR